MCFLLLIIINNEQLIAEKMGLEIKSNASLWKDKALIELNYAVLSSFQVSVSSLNPNTNIVIDPII